MNNFFNDLIRLGKQVIQASESIQKHIDEHLSSNSSSSSSEASTAAGASHAVTDELSNYQRHVQSGCPDPLELLTVEDASQMMRCPIAQPSTTGEEEYIGAHYGCTDDRSIYISLSVSALMPWDLVKDEVTSQPAFRLVGDEALVEQDMLYVRQGKHFFWIYGKGIEKDVIYSIAEHVAQGLAALQ